MMEASFTTYAQALQWITGLVPIGIRPGLSRMETMMDKLDNPHRRLKFIHVAGTNGKGSTCAFLTSVLRQCGYDVGTFTSPYLEKYTNRIQVNGEDIPEDYVLRLANTLKPVADELAGTELGSPTMFEVSTALAVLYFARVAYPDYVVWETGLGGRLDVTNIVTPVISVITNIGHDHMDILGGTIPLIAMEKAGIIKPGVPVVSAVEQPEALEVIESAAAERKSTLYLLGRQFEYKQVLSREDEQSFHFRGPFRDVNDVRITLNGEHQFKNAAVALMTLEVLRQYYALIVEDDDLLASMASTKWPGRLEMVSREPRILLDGAHNPEGAETLANALKHVYKYRRVHFMLGMLSTKNHTDYLRHILPIADTLIITEADFHKKMDARDLLVVVERVSQELGRRIEVSVEPDWKKGLEQLKQRTEQDDLAVVTGTLYLISDVRSWVLYHSDSEKGW